MEIHGDQATTGASGRHAVKIVANLFRRNNIQIMQIERGSRGRKKLKNGKKTLRNSPATKSELLNMQK